MLAQTRPNYLCWVLKQLCIDQVLTPTIMPYLFVDIAVTVHCFFIVFFRQMTPLHMAATAGYNDIVTCLVEKEAGVNMKANSGVSTITY